MSGGPKKPNTTKDNLFSQDVVELALSFGEGVVWGLEKGLEGFFVNNEPVLDTSTGEDVYNFPDFGVSFRQGYVDDLPVEFILGGEGNTVPNSAGRPLPPTSAQTFITPDSLKGKIRAVDIRFLVQALYSGDAAGNTSERGCVFRVEYKRQNLDSEFTTVKRGALSDLLLSGDRLDTLRYQATQLGLNYDAFTEDQKYVFEQNYWEIRKRVVSGDIDGTTVIFLIADALGYGSDPRIQTPAIVLKNVWLGNTIENPAERELFLNQPEFYYAIYGKTTSGYVHELRIPLPLNEDDPDNWQIKITRLSKAIPADDQYNACNISIDSLSTIAEELVTYPRICAAHIVAQHTDRFSQIPDFSCDLMGLLCDVPINYNPFDGTYGAPWLGGYKKAWTDNPVWILRELIMNPDWGDRSREPNIMISDASFYAASQYCDELVPRFLRRDGESEFVRRHTFNMVVQEYQSSADLKRFVAGSFRSVLSEVNGVYSLNTDKVRAPSFFVCPEMVTSELFDYNATDLSSRYNLMRVSFQNRENRYEEDNRVITDQEHIDRYGVIDYSMQAVGCTNLNEALRQAAFNMLTNLKETIMVSFKLPRLGLYLNQYDNLYIADRTCGWGDSGRFYRQDGNLLKTLTPVGSGQGFCTVTYHTNEGLRSIQCEQLDPITFQVDSGELGVFIAEDTPFMLASEEAGSPKLFRLMSVKDEGKGDAMLYTIDASEVFADKYTLVDALDPETLNLQFSVDRLIYEPKVLPPKPILVEVVLLDFVGVGSSFAYEINIMMPNQMAENLKYQVVWYHSDFASAEDRKTVILDGPVGILTGVGALQDTGSLNFEVTVIDQYQRAGETYYLLNQHVKLKSGSEQMQVNEVISDVNHREVYFGFTPYTFPEYEPSGLPKLGKVSDISFNCKRPVGVDVIKQPLTESKLYQSTFFSLASLVALGKAFTAPYGTEVGVNTVWVEASAQRQETLIVKEKSKSYNWTEPNNYSLSYNISESTMSGGAAALLIKATGLAVPDRFEGFDLIFYEVDSSGNIVGDGWLQVLAGDIEKSIYPTLSVKLNKAALVVGKRYRFAFSLKYAAALIPRRWHANYSAAYPAVP